MENVKVFCNGFPKHGNHPLVKACQLLGVPATVAHVPHAEGPERRADKNVFIRRDPRNALVAWLKMRGVPVTPGMAITHMLDWDGSGSYTMFEHMALYEGWLQDLSIHHIRYEDLIRDDTAMRGLAEYLGVPYLPRSWEYLPGLTPTWTGPIHSNYLDIWTPELEKVWHALGGEGLLNRWGY